MEVGITRGQDSSWPVKLKKIRIFYLIHPLKPVFHYISSWTNCRQDWPTHFAKGRMEERITLSCITCGVRLRPKSVSAKRVHVHGWWHNMPDYSGSSCLLGLQHPGPTESWNGTTWCDIVTTLRVGIISHFYIPLPGVWDVRLWQRYTTFLKCLLSA